MCSLCAAHVPAHDPQQILNLPDLLQRCNAWRHTDPASGRAYGAACSTYQPGADLPANMAGGRVV